MTQVTTIGLDLAKRIFQVHGMDAAGAVVLRRQLKRRQMVPFFTKLPNCLIGMEAYGTAHHWARTLQALGHAVRLIPPAYAKAYVRRNKTDPADAEAICEAVSRPWMRFVPIKEAAEQAMASVHRVRERLIGFHAVSTAAVGLFGGFDQWRCAAGGSFVDDDLTQVLDAVFGKRGHAILTHAVDPEAAVFGEHVDRRLVQPVFILAEQVGEVADREDGCDRRHDQAA